MVSTAPPRTKFLIVPPSSETQPNPDVLRVGDRDTMDHSTRSTFSQPKDEGAVGLADDWFNPIEAGMRDRVRQFIQGDGRGRAGGGARSATLHRPPEALRLCHRGPMPGTVLPRLNMHAAKALSNCAWIDLWALEDPTAPNPAPPRAPLAAPIPAPRPPPIAPPNPAPRAVVSAAVPSPRRLAPCTWSATACWANCRHVA